MTAYRRILMQLTVTVIFLITMLACSSAILNRSGSRQIPLTEQHPVNTEYSITLDVEDGNMFVGGGVDFAY